MDFVPRWVKHGRDGYAKHLMRRDLRRPQSTRALVCLTLS